MEEEKKLYIGNLSYETTGDDLKAAIEAKGITVREVRVISDRMTGRSKGFGFVEMASKEEAEAAISALNGKEVLGLVLNVNEAHAKKENPYSSVRIQDGDWRGNGHGKTKRY